MLVFAGWFATAASAQDEKDAMVVETKTDGRVVFFFDENPEMAFSGGSVFFETTSEKVDYPMSDVTEIKFERVKTSGIDDASLREVRFFFTDDRLTVEGLNPSALVTLYSVDGSARLQDTADADGTAVLPTGTLPKGVYVVTADKVTYKLVKK